MPDGSRKRSSRTPRRPDREQRLRMGFKEAMYVGKASVVVMYWEVHWDDHAKASIPSFTIDVEFVGERTRRHRFDTFEEAELKWKMLEREVALKLANLALNLRETK